MYAGDPKVRPDALVAQQPGVPPGLDNLLSTLVELLPLTPEKGGYRAPLWPLEIDGNAGGSGATGSCSRSGPFRDA